jgi:hypothetical protein
MKCPSTTEGLSDDFIHSHFNCRRYRSSAAALLDFYTR